jgi:hypothetical protein
MAILQTTLVGTIALAGVLLNGAAVSAQPGRPAPLPRPDTNVIVVNPLPLPVTVGNTTPIPVGGTVDVNVANPLPLPIQGTVTLDEAKIPFQASESVDGVHESLTSAWNSASLVTVPVDKRLVIEHVSAKIRVDGRRALGLDEVFVGRPALLEGSFSAPDFVPCTKTNEKTAGFGMNVVQTYWTCAMSTQYYAGPGTEVIFAVKTDTTWGGTPLGITIAAFASGYYVPVFEPASAERSR